MLQEKTVSLAEDQEKLKKLNKMLFNKEFLVFLKSRGRRCKIKKVYVKKDLNYVRCQVNIKDKKYNLSKLIMEFKLKRRLKKNEIIHHVNRNTLDNRVCNLRVMDTRKHNSFHSKGKKNAMFGKKNELHHNYRKVEGKCTFCKKTIMIKKYKISMYRRHFCDNKCFHSFMSSCGKKWMEK